VHRDLKPNNVMIARDAEGHETPKLLDFGIAKTIESDGATLTATGMVLGTPRHLSPEQAKGLSVDGRSDFHHRPRRGTCRLHRHARHLPPPPRFDPHRPPPSPPG
jgi:serine/threonine protein kinase